MAGEDATNAEVDAIDPEAFGPEDFEAMTPDEWAESFDPDTWLTGEALLDRVEGELQARVARRDVFAVVERIVNDGEPCVLAYADNGYALVRPSGAVEGFGTPLEDVKPTVALCSIPDYDPEPAPPPGTGLPDPADIEEGSGDLGNKMLQLTAFILAIGGLALVGGWLLAGVPIVGGIIGIAFLIAAVFLLFTVANARLSERYRADEYRQRLRSVGLGEGERPAFVPADERADSGSE